MNYFKFKDRKSHFIILKNQSNKKYIKKGFIKKEFIWTLNLK